MHILSLTIYLYYVVQITNCENLSNLLSYYLGIRRLCFCRCGVQESRLNALHNRMLGGEPVQPNQMPWLAFIYTNDTIVTGTLISDRHIITAASVLNEVLPSTITVSLGSNDHCEKVTAAFNSSVEAVLINPKYSYTRRNNDLALIKLRKYVSFSQHIAPICMPLFGIGDKEQLAEIASIANDDSMSPTCVARKASLPILSEKTCLTYANSSLLTPDKGCLGPIGSPGILCEEDIGAPVMTRLTSISPYRLFGVVSSASCNDNDPPLFTKIIDHLPWIKENIRRDCQCF